MNNLTTGTEKLNKHVKEREKQSENLNTIVVVAAFAAGCWKTENEFVVVYFWPPGS